LSIPFFLVFISPVLLPNLISIWACAQSLGKRCLGLKTVRPDRSACHPMRYLPLRTLPQWSCLLFAWQALRTRGLSGTVVIKAG